LESVYQLLKGEKEDNEWSEYIESHESFAVLKKVPHIRYLSKAQLDLADEIIGENRGKTGPQLGIESHDLPEWKNPQGSSLPISYSELFRVIGKTDAEVKEITDNLQSEAEFEELLSGR
jgi:hypothetical protein